MARTSRRGGGIGAGAVIGAVVGAAAGAGAVAGTGAVAGAGTGTGAAAVAGAVAGAGTGTGAAAVAGAVTWYPGRRKSDFIDFIMAYEQAAEEGYPVWESIQAGKSVLIECSQRFYFGRVRSRNTLTCILEEAAIAHWITDIAMFLQGVIPEGSQISLLPAPHEISFADIQTVQPMEAEHLPKLRRRTHAARGPHTCPGS